MSGLGGRDSEGLVCSSVFPLVSGFKSRAQMLLVECLDDGGELEGDIFCLVLVNSSGLGLWRPCVGVT